MKQKGTKNYDFTSDDIKEAIDKSNGTSCHVARILGCSQGCIAGRLRNDDDLYDYFFQHKRLMLDSAEHTLSELMKSEDEKVQLGAANSLIKHLGKFFYKDPNIENGTNMSDIILQLIKNAESDKPEGN